MSLLKNNFKCYCKNSNKCVVASVISIGISMHKIERRTFTNHSGGNSLFGSVHGVSFHMKDAKDKLPSCEACQDMLAEEIDISNCYKCCNWNILENSYSKQCVERIDNPYGSPFVLMLEYQRDKNIKIISKLCKGNVSISAAVKLLKLLNFTE